MFHQAKLFNEMSAYYIRLPHQKFEESNSSNGLSCSNWTQCLNGIQ